jgi:hypothetical protein
MFMMVLLQYMISLKRGRSCDLRNGLESYRSLGIKDKYNKCGSTLLLNNDKEKLYDRA